MQINKVTFIGKGGVGLLYGSMIAQALGTFAVVDQEMRRVMVDRVVRADIDAGPAIDAGFGDLECHLRHLQAVVGSR